ncbi:MAG: hypothetical protein Q9200_007808, partial [Gallowayella weberi]
QKNRPDNLEREGGAEIGADAQIRQPDGRFHAVDDANVGSTAAVGVYGAGGPVELDGGFDEAGEPEDEEDEGAEDDYAGEELALGDEAEEDDDED